MVILPPPRPPRRANAAGTRQYRQILMGLTWNPPRSCRHTLSPSSFVASLALRRRFGVLGEQGMAGERMSYPLRYGYSLVGKVVRCGAGVAPEEFLGRLVFSFSPHSRYVRADAGSVMVVPQVGSAARFLLCRRQRGSLVPATPRRCPPRQRRAKLVRARCLGCVRCGRER